MWRTPFSTRKGAVSTPRLCIRPGDQKTRLPRAPPAQLCRCLRKCRADAIPNLSQGIAMSRKQQDLQTSTATIAPALISRANACIVLGGVSPQTLWRAEREGVLEAVRIRPNAPASSAYYRITDIARIAGIDPEQVVWQLQQQPTKKPKLIENQPRSSLPRKR
jgi:hypothetical protein